VKIPLTLLLLIACSLRAVAFETWNWLNIDIYETERTRYHLFAEQRADDQRGSFLQVFSPQVKHRIHPNLELGMAGTLIWFERAGVDTVQARPELEVNPLLLLNNGWRFHMRNRLEARWFDFTGTGTWRTRHRLHFAKRLDNLGPLRDVYINNEWFFEFRGPSFIENRAIPAGISFRLVESVYLDFFFMIRSLERRGQWEHQPIAGTFLRWRW
jgi:hypothetical protein